MKGLIKILFLLCCFYSAAYAQEDIYIAPLGTLYTHPGSSFTVFGNVINDAKGGVNHFNGGDFYLFRNGTTGTGNSRIYDGPLTPTFIGNYNVNGSYVRFWILHTSNTIGNATPSGTLINTTSGSGQIQIEQEARVTNTHYFDSGMVWTPRGDWKHAFIHYDSSIATCIGYDNTKHIDGYAARTGNTDFNFPIGDGNYLRMSGIRSPDYGMYKSAYFLKNAQLGTIGLSGNNALRDSGNMSLPLSRVNRSEFWDIDGTAATKIMLSALNSVAGYSDWNTTTNFSSYNAEDLVITGFDKWEDLGIAPTVLSLNSDGFYVTNTAITPDSNYSAFSWAAICNLPAPVITASGATTFCIGNSITLASNYSSGNQWYKNGVMIAGATDSIITITTAGIYTDTVININGCKVGSAATTVIVNSSANTPVITATGPTIFCNGADSIILTSSINGGNQWYKDGVPIGGANNQSYKPIISGTYTVIVGVIGGCPSIPSNAITATIHAPVTPTIFAWGSTSVCPGDSVKLSSSSGYSNYKWYKDSVLIAGAANLDYYAKANGVYTVTAIDGAGCSSYPSTGTTVILQSSPATPIITANNSTTVCGIVNIVLASNIAVGNQWYLNNTLISGATNQTYTATASGNYVAIVGASPCNSSPSNTIVITKNSNAGFSVNSTYQEECTGSSNNFIFTSNTPTAGNMYSWSFGDGTSSTNVNPNHHYAAIGTYIVKQIVTNTSANCTDSISQFVTVMSCGVAGGGSGGVETKSLGDIMAKHNYANALNSVSTEVDYDKLIRSTTVNTTVVNGVNDALSLKDLIPQKVSNRADLTGYITTPTDLLNITNATEVYAVDYTNSNHCKAVALGMKTLGEAYAHTKPVCDRLKGAELLGTNIIVIQGYHFISYTLKQCDGTVEYAVSFVASKNAGRNSFSIQSNWLTNNYIQEDTMYNIQVWSADPRVTQTLVSDVLNKMKPVMHVNETATTANDMPATYITSGNRNRTNLLLNINNPTTAKDGYFELKEKSNETGATTIRTIPFTILPNHITALTLPMSDKYESNVFMYVNGKLTDLVYMNDGAWSLDYNPQTTTIHQFTISNDASVNTNSNEYPLYRTVQISATTKDYLSIYKMVRGDCGEYKDLTAYNAIKFYAALSGVGTLRITLVKKGITNWNKQYYYKLQLNGNKEYSITLNKLVALNTQENIIPDDISEVVFSLETNGQTNNIIGTISKARFTKETITYNQSLQVNVLNVYPNPNKGKFTVAFSSDADQSLIMRIIDAGTGVLLHTMYIKAVKGVNSIAVDISTGMVVSQNCILTLEGDAVKYSPKKLMIQRK